MIKIETKEGINWTPLVFRLKCNSLTFEHLEPAEQEEIRQIFQPIFDWINQFWNNLLKFVETLNK